LKIFIFCVCSYEKKVCMYKILYVWNGVFLSVHECVNENVPKIDIEKVNNNNIIIYNWWWFIGNSDQIDILGVFNLILNSLVDIYFVYWWNQLGLKWSHIEK